MSKPYERRTLALRGTVSRIEAQLDHPSLLAVAYARQWLKAGPAQMDVDVLASGVVRRALQRYIEHLGDSTIDPAAEARAVRLCCSSPPVPEEDREDAMGLMPCLDPGQPLPAWPEVLHGSDRTAHWTAFQERVDQSVDSIATSRWGRLKRMKTRAEASGQ